jgi:hypothetical protein
MPLTILCCDALCSVLWRVLISLARLSCSGMVGGFWWEVDGYSAGGWSTKVEPGGVGDTDVVDGVVDDVA